MGDEPLKEYHAFTSLMDTLLSVPKAAIDARVAQHRHKALQNPMRPGPKPKEKTAEPEKPRRKRR